jgi:hypothetical protein
MPPSGPDHRISRPCADPKQSKIPGGDESRRRGRSAAAAESAAWLPMATLDCGSPEDSRRRTTNAASSLTGPGRSIAPVGKAVTRAERGGRERSNLDSNARSSRSRGRAPGGCGRRRPEASNVRACDAVLEPANSRHFVADRRPGSPQVSRRAVYRGGLRLAWTLRTWDPPLSAARSSG